MTPKPLIGRQPELDWLLSLLGRIESGGTSILVRGEVGIGRTALLAEVAGEAADRGISVLSTTGVESERHLPFAGLHQLLRPVLPRIDDLAPPQRDSLRAALGMADLEAPALFRTALAVLDLLSGVASQKPLLVVADDVQWLDRPSWTVLAFLSRRVGLDPILVLASAREGDILDPPAFAGDFVPLPLGALDITAAAALLNAQAPHFTTSMRTRLLAEAAGNPLALVELPLAADVSGEQALLPAGLGLTERLEQAFSARAFGLPAGTRALLLVAAVNDGDDLHEILAAGAECAGCAFSLHDLSPAVAARLVEDDARRVRFRHPLIRSAIYQGASLGQRNAAHAALAYQLVDEPDRQVWHRAAASTGPDEQVAADLERAARRAARRGAPVIAQAALERAARLSAGPATRGRRLLEAAEAAFELGRHDTLSRLLRDAEGLSLHESERLRLAWLRERFLAITWSGAERAAGFVQVAEELRLTGDPDRSLESLLAISQRCWWSNPDQRTREQIVAVADSIPVPEDDPRLIAVLALAAPIERGAEVLGRLSRLPTEAEDPVRLLLLGTAATAVGAFDQSLGYLDGAVAGLRAQGRFGLLAEALVAQAWAGVHLGSAAVGEPPADEAQRLAAETGRPLWAAVAQLAQATMASRRGDLTTAEALTARAEQVIVPIGANSMLALVQIARGAGALAEGRHGDAFEQLLRVFNPADTPYHPYARAWAVADLCESAIHSDHSETARTMVHEIEELAQGAGWPVLHVALLYARAVLADDQHADVLFTAGLNADLSRWPLLRARLQLAHGAWLRRQRRISEARISLRAAVEACDALGAVPWAERARQELRAAGCSALRNGASTWAGLTAQELQIARMAADGLTNKEIGGQLYLSHRTVSTHLHRIYPKLAVTSRAQLRAVLDRLTSAGIPPMPRGRQG